MSKKKRKRPRHTMEYKEYASKLNKHEKEWIKEFYNEYYSTGFYKTEEEGGQAIIPEGEIRSEAIRNNNSNNRDLFNVSKKAGILDYLETSDMENVTVSDNLDLHDEWQEVYKYKGYKAAIQKVFDITLNELYNKHVNKEVILAQFYIRMERLRKQNRKDKRNKRKKV